MKDFEDIKALWKKQEEIPLNYNEIVKSIRDNQKGYAKKLIIQSTLVLILLAIILTIWLIKPFSTWTTHLSMLILSVCLVFFLVKQFRDYRNVSNMKQHLFKPQDFIEYLQEYKKRSFLLNKQNFTFYSIGIGLAFLLILFEMYFIISLWLLLLFVLLATWWFIMSYHFLIKDYIRTETKRIECMIDQLKHLKDQLKD